MMVVYAISYYDTNSGSNDGVLWIASSKEKALDIIKRYSADTGATVDDIEEDLIGTAVYTCDGVYHIERFTVDDDDY